MAQQLSNGKWNPIVWDNGYVGMVELTNGINGVWKPIECDTKEEAEQMEKEYREFWEDK